MQNMPEHRSVGGSPAGPPAARWRESVRAAEPAAVQPARPPALRLAALFFLAGCASVPMTVPENWETVPTAKLVGPETDHCLFFDCAISPRPANIRVWQNQLFNGSNALTPVFAGIDSYDVSLERREVVFSAKRKDNFDIGLVSMDGSDIHWVPEDPADETNPVWAPRGNKVAYIVHGKAGDTVRTVHIPTATQLSVPFPY